MELRAVESRMRRNGLQGSAAADERGLRKLKRFKETGPALLLFVAMSIASPAQTFTSLVSFNGSNGSSPSAPLVVGADGNLYGTTGEGGQPSSYCPYATGCGTIFKVSVGGVLTTLYNFCSQPNCTDSAASVLIQGADGNLYGMNNAGGPSSYCAFSNGCGAIFKVSVGGVPATLYNFCSQPNCTDGQRPNGLVQGADGNFYGTTMLGGNCPVEPEGCGTVFRITPGGALTTLYNFCSQTNCPDGAVPAGNLLQATDGNFYGTTISGGDPTCRVQPTQSNCGTLFKITPQGELTTVSWVGGTPTGPLVQATDGNFYGTTASSYSVFKVTPGGTLTTLAVITCCYSGWNVGLTGLVQASDGSFYGTMIAGLGYGAIFKVTPGGAVTTLFSFSCSETVPRLGCVAGPYGYSPQVPPVQAANGILYGTTPDGGAYNQGTIFSLDVGLSPFVPVTLIPNTQMPVTASGLAYSRVTRTFNGTVTITNASGNAMNGPFQVVFGSLPGGVTVANAPGTYKGTPYITANVASLTAGQSATVSVQFNNPANATINFAPLIYSGRIN